MAVGAFRPDADPPFDPFVTTEVSAGLIHRQSFEPGPEREETIANIRDHFGRLAEGLDSAADELRTLVASHEPVELISSVAIPAGMRLLARGDSIDDAPDTVSWPAKIEYLVGVALSVPPGTGHTPQSATQRVMDLVSDIFDATHAREMLTSFDRPSTGNRALDETVFVIRMEHLIDRMPGYATHLERIDAELFDSHRDYYIATLGFDPGDVVRIVRRHSQVQQERGAAAMAMMQKMVTRDLESAAYATRDFFDALTDSRTWEPAVVAELTGMDPQHVLHMLEFFSTSFNSQPDFRLPTDANLARSHPAIKLESGTYFIPDTWTLAAAVHPRLSEASSAVRGPGRYRTHREQGHQRLVARALSDVFPAGTVYESQHYDDEDGGHGEIDALVTCDWPLIVEAKAHGLTAAGRRGAPRRVERVAGDVVEAALQQTERASSYIVDHHGREFSPAEGAATRTLLPAEIASATEIIVTFERMDPLAMLGTGVVGRESRPVWIVGLADFLMVCELFDQPAELHHYARTRANTAVAGPAVYVESDAVGGYLINRLQITEPDNHLVMLGYSSEVPNAYFTARELGHDASKPTTGTERDVLSALAQVMPNDTGLWTKAVDEVMGAAPEAWRRWRRYRRRHPRRGLFLLTPSLALLGGEVVALTSEDGAVRLGLAGCRP